MPLNMKLLPYTTWLFPLLLTLFLSNCNFQQDPAEVPLAVKQYLATLPPAEQPVKVIADAFSHKIYWLSFVGEIYRIHPDGSQCERVIRGVGASRKAMFIEDFCLDSRNNRLFFTDLMDQATGLSAIKQADLSGKHITTVLTSKQEIPYRVSISPYTGQLYYLTKTEHFFKKVYRLRTLGEEKPLMASLVKINDLARWADRVMEQKAAVSSHTEVTLARR